MKYIEYSPEELEVLRAASVPITEQDMTGILFGFADFNAGDDFTGSYGGFSFVLYDTGLIKVQEYLFGAGIATEHRYCVPQTCVREIMQYYADNQDTLFFLSAPDNGSCDGSFSEFFFGNAWISALNIEYNDEKKFEQVQKVHPKDFDYWAEIMLAENKIMTAFFSVCNILKKYDIILEQFRVTVKGEATTTYDEFMKSFHKKHRK